ncbi:hypothetical protein Ndes2526A_g06557 [Nannochloris sp. 'desiccata']|nr:hypothetical protein KSW81_008355 [Chlorella desiccata (nom. nud.)]
MPGVRAFGRKWLIAEDDIPVPAFIMAIFHLVWIGPMVSCYIITYDTVRCKHVTRTTIALSGLLFGFVCSIASEISCIVIGLRGTMFERSKRRRLPFFIYANTFAHVIQVIFNSYLTYLIYRDFNLDCDSQGGVWQPDDFLLALNVAEWIYIGIMILFLILIFNPRGVFSDPAAWQRHYSWIMWLGFCCWNPLSSRQRKMQRERAKQVGANLCALFGHVDITITDAWAAFMVARTLYKQHGTRQEEAAVGDEKRRRRGDGQSFSAAAAAGTYSLHPTRPDISNRSTKTSTFDEILVPPQVQEINNNKIIINGQLPYPSPPLVLPVPEPGTLVDHATLVEAQHFFTYTLATYGWMLYIFDNGIRALGELACGCSPLGWHGRIAPCGLGQLNTQVAMKTLNASKNDILFLREEGALPDVLSYIIAVDHSRHSIVVAVRGALSIMDNVRDLLFEAVELDNWLSSPWSWETLPPPAPEVKRASPEATTAEPVDENTCFQKFLAQGDYLHVAYQTLGDILYTGVLKNAISGSNPQYPGYKLVLTGHSLGAAVSYLIALRLRLAIPDLNCWAFSPPMGLVSASLGAASSDWCTSVVCGKELPPRYSVATLDRALQDMMAAAAQCRLPKLQILTGWLGGTAAMKNNAPEGQLLWKPNEIPEEVQNVLNAAVASAEGNMHRKYLLETSGTFGLPGRVFHLQLIAKHSKNGRKKVNGGSCSSCCGGSDGIKDNTKDQSNTTSSSSSTTSTVKANQRPLPEREYHAVWIDSAELAKEGLQMSGRVISDHMPDFIAGVLRQVALFDGEEERTGEEEERVRGRVGTATAVEADDEAVDVEGGLKSN